MQVVFANDTSGTSNPGCQGTVYCLSRLINETGWSIESRIPVTYGNQLINRAKRNQAANTRKPYLPNFLTQRFYSDSEPLKSKHIIDQTAELFAERLASSWRHADALVINAEGTIHSDSVGAHSLLALCQAAKSLSKSVYLINGSISKLSVPLLNVLRESVDYISVREPISGDYLRKNEIEYHLSADCLFLARESDWEYGAGHWLPEPKYAVYTPGVLTYTGRVKSDQIKNDIGSICDAGLHPVFYIVEKEDEPFAKQAEQSGASIIPLGSLNWRSILPFLSDAELVITGRYHVAIFAALAGSPFVPLETNTPKMAGLLELLNIKSQTIRGWDTNNDETLPLDLENPINVSTDTLLQCTQMAAQTHSHNI